MAPACPSYASPLKPQKKNVLRRRSSTTPSRLPPPHRLFKQDIMVSEKGSSHLCSRTDVAITSTSATTARHCVTCQLTYTTTNSVGIGTKGINVNMCTPCHKREKRKNQNRTYYFKQKEREMSKGHGASNSTISIDGRTDTSAGISKVHNIQSEMTIPLRYGETSTALELLLYRTWACLEWIDLMLYFLLARGLLWLWEPQSQPRLLARMDSSP